MLFAAYRRPRVTGKGSVLRLSRYHILGEAALLHFVPRGFGRPLAHPASHWVTTGALKCVLALGGVWRQSLDSMLVSRSLDDDPDGGLFLLRDGALGLHAHDGVLR